MRGYFRYIEFDDLFEYKRSNSREYPGYESEGYDADESSYELCLGFFFYFSFIEPRDRDAYSEDDHKKHSQYETNKKDIFVDASYKVGESCAWWYATFISSHLIRSSPNSSWWFSEFTWLTCNCTYCCWCSKTCIRAIIISIFCQYRETYSSKHK